MHILFLTPNLPYPLYQGTALRNYGLIKGLADRGHSVSLLSFVKPDETADNTPLIDLCEQVVTVEAPTRSLSRRLLDLAGGRVDLVERRASDAFGEALSQMLAATSFDVIHIEGLEMSAYIEILEQESAEATLIYDAHNAEYALQERIAQQDIREVSRLPFGVYSQIQARRLKRWEAQLCQRVDLVFACSAHDANLLRDLPTHKTPVAVIPNAIDTAEYTVELREKPSWTNPSLVFTGKMDFRPNVDAVLWCANTIMPLVHRDVPTAHLNAVGQKPHPRLLPLQSRSDVTITGFVPQIEPYIHGADLYVAPLRMGSGTRFKLLQAMAMGKAVVSTSIGAEGLDVIDGDHLLLADDEEVFAQAVAALLQDRDRRAEIGQRAAALVREKYDWSAVIPQVEVAYTEHLS